MWAGAEWRFGRSRGLDGEGDLRNRFTTEDTESTEEEKK